MTKSLKSQVIESARNKFDEIPKTIQITEFKVNLGWLEIHTVESNKCSLIEFLVSSMRHVKFWKYTSIDQGEFEQDISNGKYDMITSEEAYSRMEFMRGLCSESLKTISNEVIPQDLQSLSVFESIILIYDEWNNCSLTLITNSTYKNIYFGTSE